MDLQKRLKFSIYINTAMAIVQMAAGFLVGSLALISDAFHNATDSLSLVISYIANVWAKKLPDQKKTIGYGQVEILAGLVNGVILVFLAAGLLYEAYNRFLNPSPVNNIVVIIFGLIGIAGNSGIVRLLWKFKSDINIKSVLVNMKYDIISSVGVFVAGVVMYFTGVTWADPAASLLIAIFLFISSVGVIKEAGHLILNGIPLHLEFEKIKNTLVQFPNVTNVHGLRVWAKSSTGMILSAHIVTPLSETDPLIEQIKEHIKSTFDIHDITLQVENKHCNYEF